MYIFLIFKTRSNEDPGSNLRYIDDLICLFKMNFKKYWLLVCPRIGTSFCCNIFDAFASSVALGS